MNEVIFLKNVGIIMRLENFEHSKKLFINQTYMNSFFNYNVHLIPIWSTLHIQDQIQSLDGLVIPGGYDIKPFYLKQNYNRNCTYYQHHQDTLDFTWCDAFVKEKKPILGICRGMQIIATYFKGSLCQHFDTNLHEISPNKHYVTPKKNTIFQQLINNEHLVNSFHHQYVKDIGPILEIGAISTDKKIEGIYHPTLPIYGVQWHPELLEDDFIIPYFCDLILNALYF